jgi:hypothetical protein
VADSLQRVEVGTQTNLPLFVLVAVADEDRGFVHVKTSSFGNCRILRDSEF